MPFTLDNSFTKLENLAKLIHRCYGLNYHIQFYSPEDLIVGQYSSIDNVSITPQLYPINDVDQTDDELSDEEDNHNDCILNFSIPKEFEIISLDMNNEKSIANYLFSCFEEIQQATCKKLAKNWIKIVEPSKQSNFPYKGLNATSPGWWPLDVIHREPDHLKKNDRIKLLMQISHWFKDMYGELIEQALQLSEFKDRRTHKPKLRMQLIAKQIFKVILNPKGERYMDVFRVGKNFSNKTILRARQDYLSGSSPKNQDRSVTPPNPNSSSLTYDDHNVNVDSKVTASSLDLDGLPHVRNSVSPSLNTIAKTAMNSLGGNEETPTSTSTRTLSPSTIAQRMLNGTKRTPPSISTNYFNDPNLLNLNSFFNANNSIFQTPPQNNIFSSTDTQLSKDGEHHSANYGANQNTNDHQNHNENDSYNPTGTGSSSSGTLVGTSTSKGIQINDKDSKFKDIARVKLGLGLHSKSPNTKNVLGVLNASQLNSLNSTASPSGGNVNSFMKKLEFAAAINDCATPNTVVDGSEFVYTDENLVNKDNGEYTILPQDSIVRK